VTPGIHLPEAVLGMDITLCEEQIVLVAGIVIAFGALILRLQDVLFGEASGSRGRVKASYVPLFVHLGLVLTAGLWLPEAGVRWFRVVAAQLG